MLSLPLVVNGFSNTEFGVSNPLSISPLFKRRGMQCYYLNR